jgi:hypothetical protein
MAGVIVPEETTGLASLGTAVEPTGVALELPVQ